MPRQRNIDRVVDRVLTRLRNAIRERHFTQLEVQEALGWGRSYISQLLTKQKTLRVEQVLLVLNVINVTPEDFFSEVFQFGAFGPNAGTQQRKGQAPPPPVALFHPDAGGSMKDDLRRLQLLYGGVAAILIGKGYFDSTSLEHAIEKAKRNPEGPIP